jgi:hypothetical protein
VVSGRRVLGAFLVVCIATALLTGIVGGLVRVGFDIGAADAAWLGQAALAHAALMICGFMGTVIGIERAVAAKQRLAWSAPLASGLAALALLNGLETLAGALFAAAAVAFVGVNLLLWRRQAASHTTLLLVSAGAWLIGNLLFALGAAAVAVLPWWFTFLVITIAAERLEMTRLMRRRPAAQPALYAVFIALLLGAALTPLSPAAGGVMFGAALLALAAWLFAFDITRRTVRATGLPRYLAICLLGGYAWLAVAGIAWAASALGLPARDLALHALGLGFIVSMMMGHAPVILPAVARMKLLYGPWFYLPLAALHGSLLLRLLAGLADLHFRQQGALANALAIALFALTVAGAAFAWRRRHGPGAALPNRP